MRISDWSSDVCSSDLIGAGGDDERGGGVEQHRVAIGAAFSGEQAAQGERVIGGIAAVDRGDRMAWQPGVLGGDAGRHGEAAHRYRDRGAGTRNLVEPFRSEEHTSELQSLMRISYAVFCLKKKKKTTRKKLQTAKYRHQVYNTPKETD